MFRNISVRGERSDEAQRGFDDAREQATALVQGAFGALVAMLAADRGNVGHMLRLLLVNVQKLPPEHRAAWHDIEETLDRMASNMLPVRATTATMYEHFNRVLLPMLDGPAHDASGAAADQDVSA